MSEYFNDKYKKILNSKSGQYKDIDSESDSESGKNGEGVLSTNAFLNSDTYKKLGFREERQIIDTEKENKLLAEQALFDTRINIKSKGYEVTALTKIQELKEKMENKIKKRLSNSSGTNSPSGGGTGHESHPDLPEMGGEADPNNIILPESEELSAERASNDPKLQNKLKNKLQQKFGMGGAGRDVSAQTMKAEFEKKQRQRIVIREKLEEKPRFSPQAVPKPEKPQ